MRCHLCPIFGYLAMGLMSTFLQRLEQASSSPNLKWWRTWVMLKEHLGLPSWGHQTMCCFMLPNVYLMRTCFWSARPGLISPWHSCTAMRHIKPIFTMKTPFWWMRKFLPLFQGLSKSSLNGAYFNSLNGSLLWWLLLVRPHLLFLEDSCLLGNPLLNSELPLLFLLKCLLNGGTG